MNKIFCAYKATFDYLPADLIQMIKTVLEVWNSPVSGFAVGLRETCYYRLETPVLRDENHFEGRLFCSAGDLLWRRRFAFDGEKHRYFLDLLVISTTPLDQLPLQKQDRPLHAHQEGGELLPYPDWAKGLDETLMTIETADLRVLDQHFFQTWRGLKFAPIGGTT